MRKIHLDKIDTHPGTESITKKEAADSKKSLKKKLSELQNRLYAQRRYKVLIILQGMDTSGKDSTVKHVFSGVNPSGCKVKSFKVPSEEEAAHHFLWRISKECPEKGFIQIFNRSHYEDILVPVINKQLTVKQKEQRYADINAFESALAADETIIFKFYLHVSQEEQFKRLEERKQNVRKQWKYQAEDARDIGLHDSYKKIYEDIIAHTSGIPWSIVPADIKWFKNYSILKTIVSELEKYDIEYPLK